MKENDKSLSFDKTKMKNFEIMVENMTSFVNREKDKNLRGDMFTFLQNFVCNACLSLPDELAYAADKSKTVEMKNGKGFIDIYGDEYNFPTFSIIFQCYLKNDGYGHANENYKYAGCDVYFFGNQNLNEILYNGDD